MVARFRAFEEEALTAGTRPRKQIIVAVTANRSDDLCSADSNFDFVCSKPIEIQNIQHIIQTCFSRGSDDNV